MCYVYGWDTACRRGLGVEILTTYTTPPKFYYSYFLLIKDKRLLRLEITLSLNKIWKLKFEIYQIWEASGCITLSRRGEGEGSSDSQVKGGGKRYR